MVLNIIKKQRVFVYKRDYNLDLEHEKFQDLIFVDVKQI